MEVLVVAGMRSEGGYDKGVVKLKKEVAGDLSSPAILMAMKDNSLWTEELKNKLSLEYTNKNLKELSLLFPFATEKEIQNKACSMKLKHSKEYRRKCSYEEVKSLHDKGMASSDIAKKLSIHRVQVNVILKKLGVKRSNMPGFSVEEDALIKRYYAEDKDLLYKSINKCRETINSRARKIGADGVRARKVWSNEEDEIIINNYPSHPASFILKLLKKRGVDSLNKRISYLGVKKNNTSINHSDLFKNNQECMYWTGIIFGNKAFFDSNGNDKSMQISLDEKDMNDFTRCFNLTGTKKQNKSFNICGFKKIINICNINKKFNLSFISNDKMFLWWFIGFIDYSHHNVPKECSYGIEKMGDRNVLIYCASRINLICNTKITLLKNSAIRIYEDDLIKIISSINSNNITIGKFWKQPKPVSISTSSN